MMRYKTRPKTELYCLALYDPVDPDAPPEELESHLYPDDICEAADMVREYNRLAAESPLLTKLLGLFPARQVRRRRRRKANPSRSLSA